MAARGLLLKHLRVQVQVVPQNPSSTGSLLLSSFHAIRRRFFSEEIRGSFLDKSEVTDRVISVVKNFQKVDPAKVTPIAHFQNDLGLDSLDAVELVMALEEEFRFEIPDNEADKISSISLAVDFIASHPQAKFLKKIIEFGLVYQAKIQKLSPRKAQFGPKPISPSVSQAESREPSQEAASRAKQTRVNYCARQSGGSRVPAPSSQRSPRVPPAPPDTRALRALGAHAASSARVSSTRASSGSFISLRVGPVSRIPPTASRHVSHAQLLPHASSARCAHDSLSARLLLPRA